MLEAASGRLEELLRKAGIEASPAVVRGALVLCGLLAALAAWRAWQGGGGGSAEGEMIGSSVPATIAAAPAAARKGDAASENTSITAHIVGAVRRPGVYRLASGSRVEDLVAAAGGLLGSAEQAGVNLARPVADGEQVAVPKKGETPRSAAPTAQGWGASSGPSTNGLAGPDAVVDINHATAAELDVLPGVGVSTAQKIIDDREANGPFSSPEDLMRVSGIGPKRFEQMKPKIVAR